MNEIKAKVLSSRFVNSGIVGKFKEWIYSNFISDRLESRTDEHRTSILNDFYEIFDEDEWILGFGCFLRFYRDQTMDGQDIDILMCKEAFQKNKRKLQEKGYLLGGEFFDVNGRTCEYKLIYKNAEIDIFIVFERNGKFYYDATYEDEEHKDKVIREVIGEQRIVRGEGYCSFRKEIPDLEGAVYEFQGMKFIGYKNIDAHLSAEYGDWQVPDPNFNPTTTTKGNPFVKIPGAKVVYYYKSPKEVY